MKTLSTYLASAIIRYKGVLLNFKFVLIIWLLSFSQTICFSAVSVIDTAYSTAPGWVAGQPINICSDNFHIQIIITSTTTISNYSFNNTIPQTGSAPYTTVEGLNSLTCGTGNLISGAGQIDYILNLTANVPCTLDVIIRVPCDYITSTNGTSQFNITFSNGSTFPIVLAKPIMILDNFKDSNLAPIVQGVPQTLVFTSSTFRQFDLIATNGIIEELTLNYTEEQEIDFDHFELYTCTNISDPACTASGATLTSVNPITTINGSMIQQITGISNRLQQGDFIRVREYFSVNQCTNDANNNDGSQYSISLPCNNRNPVQNCFQSQVQNRSILSLTSTTGIGVAMSITNPLDICGIDSSIIKFKFNNPNYNNGIDNSGHKIIENIKFTLNTNWFNYDINDVYLTGGGDTVPLNTLINPTAFLTYLNGVFTMNFNTVDFVGSSPLPNVFQDLYVTDTAFNDFLENTNFTIEFRNVLFDCNGVNDDMTFFTDCNKGVIQNSYIFFGPSSSYSETASYTNMCGTHYTNLGLSDADDYTNGAFPETVFLEANPTDVTSSNPNVTLDYFFSYNGVIPNANPFRFNRYYDVNYSPYFQCPDLSYYADIKISTNYSSLTTANVTYYPDPNLSTTAPTVVSLFGTEPGYNIYRITGIDHDGKLSLNCSLLPCGGGAHGFDYFYFELRSRCKEGCVDDKCDYVIKCKQDSLYRHCQGACGNTFVVGTCGVDDPNSDCVGLEFNRTSFGWLDEQMTTQLNASSPGVSLNRAYPCDLIGIKSRGAILSTFPVDEMYYSILCNASNAGGAFVNHNFFEFVDARFEDDLGNLIYQLSVSDFSVVNPTSLSTEYKFSISDTVLLASLQAGSGTNLIFKATMRVNDDLNATYDPYIFANSYYEMPQIRGQFKARVGTTHHESCDSWGDNMTILNVKTFVRQVDNNIGCPDDPYHGLCERSFKLTTEVSGGFTNFMEDFPYEFRPITLWPTNVGNDIITMQIPSGIRLDNTYGAAFFNIQEWGTSWASAIYNFDSGSQTVTFSGYNPIGGGSPVNNWPVLDNHGSQIKMTLSGYFVNDCPPQLEDTIDVVLHAPFIEHAYTSDMDCRSNQTIETSGITFEYASSDYDLVMISNVQYPIQLSSNQASFNNLSLRLDYFNPNCCAQCGSISIKNIWLKVPVVPGSISITSINGYTPDANGYIIIPNSALPGNVLMQGVPYQLNMQYQINNCTAGTQFPFIINYGFSCVGNPGDTNYSPCLFKQDTIQFNTELSGFGFAVTNLAPLSGSPCNTYPFLITLNSTLNGDVENPTLTINGANMNMGNPTFCDNDSTPCTPPLPSFTPYNYNAPLYNWDIDQVVLGNNGGLPGSATNNYQFYVDFTGDCSMANGAVPIVFTFNGSNICNAPLTQTNTLNIVFPFGQTENCGECSPCDSLSIAYIQKDSCRFSFNAVVPTFASCTSSTVTWDFGDGSGDSGSSVSHQYTSNGTYIVCYKWVCFQGSIPMDTCMVCDTLIVNCMTEAFCLKIPKENDADIGEGIMETPDGGFALAATLYKTGSGGDKDMYFVKYDPNINQEYYNRIGDYGNSLYKENGNSILVRPDGYFIAGTLFLNSSDEDIFVAKVKLDGSWEYGFRYASQDKLKEGAFKIIDMSSRTEQALLVVGYTELKEGNKNVLALKLNPSDLSIIAQNTYFYADEESSQEIGYDAVKTGIHTMTDHFAIVGEQYSDIKDKNIIVLNIASDLTLLSGKIVLATKRSDIGYGITATNGSLYITGSTSYDSGPKHLLVMKLSAFGLAYESHMIYSQTNSTMEEGRKIIADVDGSIVIVGNNETDSPTSGIDALIIKLRPSNDLSKIWSMSTNIKPYNERFQDVTEFRNDSYLATGSYEGSTFGDEDIFVARVDRKSGESCCLTEYPVYGKQTNYDFKDVKDEKPKLDMKPHGEFPKFGENKFICGAENSLRFIDHESIISNSNNNDISIYPNPTTGEFVIRFENSFKDNCVIKVADPSGRFVKTIELRPDMDGKILINGNDLAPGIYFMEISSKNDKWKSKILINR